MERKRVDSKGRAPRSGGAGGRRKPAATGGLLASVAPPVASEGPFDSWPSLLYVIVPGFTACPADPEQPELKYVCDTTSAVFCKSGPLYQCITLLKPPPPTPVLYKHGACTFEQIVPQGSPPYNEGPCLGIHSEGAHWYYYGRSMAPPTAWQVWDPCPPSPKTECGTDMPSQIFVGPTPPPP